MPSTLSEKLLLKEMELESLFGVIKAINSNQTEDALFRLFRLTLNSNINIQKMAMYVFEDEWELKSSFGTINNFKRMALPSFIRDITNPCSLHNICQDNPFSEFQKIIPIKHKTTVLAYVLITGREGVGDDLLDINFVEALSNIIIVAIENKRFYRKEQQQKEYQRQLEIARKVQGMLVPDTLPYNVKLKVVADYMPHHSIGGDYYDYIELSKDKFFLCIADVSGKGIPAALLMSNFQAALRTLIRRAFDLEETVQELNKLVIENSRGEHFITAFFMIYDAKNKTLRYINAGHNPPILIEEGKAHRLMDGTTVLGGFDELPILEVGYRKMKPFTLFCFTDGVTETFNHDEEQFGEDSLEEFLLAYQDLDIDRVHPKLFEILDSFKGTNEYADDITLLSCRVEG